MTIETLKETPTSKEIKIIVNNDEFQQNYEKKLKKLAKTVKLEGFRKGRVPVALIKKRFGKSIKAEVTEELLEKTSDSYLKDLTYIMVTRPEMDDFKQEKDGSFYYTIKFEHVPEFELKDYKNLDIEIEEEKFDEKKFDEYLKNNFLPGFSKRVAVEDRDTVEKEDIAIVDIKAVTKEGEEVKELNKTDFPLEVGKDIFKGIDEAIIGKKVGDKIEFEYKKDDESNPVLFNIEIKKLERFEVPELNEEFVQQYFAHGREEYGVEEFLKDLKAEYQNQLDKINHGKMVDSYLKLMIEKYDFEIPETVWEQSKEIFLEKYKRENPDAKLDNKEEILKENEKEIKDIAKTQVILLKIKDLENIYASEYEIVNFINDFAIRYGMPKEETLKMFSDKNRYNEVLTLIENEKLERFIVENNKIKDITESASGKESEK